ncbi:autotransporter outer membrane beta-barrel domain-containing protein [Vibrio profundum]|uniref:hypothetical protein n=1 Tax=Vibrio profundum TaxID=2910247 RepID=UPI003D11A8BE
MPMMLRPENLYFEVGVGQAEQTIPTIGFNNDASDTQTSIRIAIGQEEPTALNWMTGIDFGYSHFGTADLRLASGDQIRAKTSALDLSLTTTYRIDQIWSIFGKGGLGYMISDVERSSLGTKERDKALKPLLGLGLRLRVGYAVDVKATVTHYFGDKSVENTEQYVPVVDEYLLSFHFPFY